MSFLAPEENFETDWSFESNELTARMPFVPCTFKKLINIEDDLDFKEK